jgi:hypothetical protein
VREFQRGFQRKKPEKIGLKAPLPEFVSPAPASVPKRVPEGARWIHDIKFDGYSCSVANGPKRKPLSAQKGSWVVSSGPFASCSIPESVRLPQDFGGHHGRREING